ncbi:MAG: tetratricopeptide repeat protein [Candidatus Korobacteraceae bacterium]
MAVRAYVNAPRFLLIPKGRLRLRLRWAPLMLGTLLFTLPALSQGGSGAPLTFTPQQGIAIQMSNSPTGRPDDTRRGVKIQVTILDSNKQPLKQQSLVRVTSQDTGAVFFQTTKGTQSSFSDLPPGKYLIEVGSAGYVGGHAEVNITDLAHDAAQNFLLPRDPAAVNLSLGDEALPSKVRKQAEKGVQALELGNFVEARKYLDSAHHQDPTSPKINFLLAYTALQQKEEDRELEYLQETTKLDPQDLQAQNMLGELYYRRGEYARAAQAEAIVVARSKDSVPARKVLASSYLKLKQFDKAREQSQWLVDHGGSEAASARLVLGQALAGLGKYGEAVPVLQDYLKNEPGSSVAPQVKELIADLQKDAASAKLTIPDPDLGNGTEILLKAGMPLDVDSQKPNVAAGVSCPANLMQLMANPSKQLVDSVSQFSAIEHMVHESISPQGTPRNRETREYNYVVSISDPPDGIVRVQEYRDSGNLEMPDKITTTGLPVLAIAFHPLFRDDFEMKCEGLGDWNGKAAWLVYFHQLANKPSRLRSYVVNRNNYPISLKGRAWISADNYQILHMETDLVKPIPEIRLNTEHTSVSYGPVEFRQHSTDLWLPKSADMYVSLGNRRFHRSENFDHFMLFATDASEAAKPPKAETTPPPVPNSGPSPNE